MVVVDRRRRAAWPWWWSAGGAVVVGAAVVVVGATVVVVVASDVEVDDSGTGSSVAATSIDLAGRGYPRGRGAGPRGRADEHRREERLGHAPA